MRAGEGRREGGGGRSGGVQCSRPHSPPEPRCWWSTLSKAACAPLVGPGWAPRGRAAAPGPRGAARGHPGVRRASCPYRAAAEGVSGPAGSRARSRRNQEAARAADVRERAARAPPRARALGESAAGAVTRAGTLRRRLRARRPAGGRERARGGRKAAAGARGAGRGRS